MIKSGKGNACSLADRKSNALAYIGGNRRWLVKLVPFSHWLATQDAQLRPEEMAHRAASAGSSSEIMGNLYASRSSFY